MMVDIEAVVELPNIVPLEDVRNNPSCENMLLVRKGQRLSVQPVEEVDFDEVLRMSGFSRSQLDEV
jgi:predicted RNA-binding protein with PUA-like domain